MPLQRRTSSARRTFGGGGTTTFVRPDSTAPSGGGGGSTPVARSGSTSSSSRSTTSLADYTARLEASHRLQVERSLITNQNALSKARSSSEMTMGRWLAQQSVLLTDRRDKEALDRIAKGDAAYGMSYARRRMEEAKASGDDDDYVYWRDIADRSKERAEDDYISGLVSSGEFGPEDILPVLRARQAQQKVGSPGYMALSKQIGEANNAVKAAAFNRDISGAHARFIQTGDRKGYMTDLLGFFAKAKEQTVRTQLQSRITNLQKEADVEEEAGRKKGVTEKVLAYYADRNENPASGVLFYLADAVKNAKTPQEAQGLITLASNITARERTLQQDAMRAAGGSGSSRSGSSGSSRGSSSGGSSSTSGIKAVDAELESERLDLKHATAHLKDSVLGKSAVPTPAEWAIYWAAGDKVLAGIDAALGSANLTTAQRKTLTSERLAVTNGDNGRENMKGRAAAVVKAESQRLENGVLADLAASKTGFGGVAAGIETVRSRITEMRRLQESPFLVGEKDHEAAVAKNIQEVLKPVVAAIERASGIIGKADKESFIDGARPDDKLAFDKADAEKRKQLYESFLGKYRNANPNAGTREPDFNAWATVMGDDSQSNEDRARNLDMYRVTPAVSESVRFDAIRDARVASALLGSNDPRAKFWTAASTDGSAEADMVWDRNVTGGSKAMPRPTGSPDAVFLDAVFSGGGGDDMLDGSAFPPSYGPDDGGAAAPIDGSPEESFAPPTDFSATDNDPMWGNEGFLDESERTYRRIQGSQEAQAANDFLDSTISMDIPGWTLPDEPDQSPFLDDNIDADAWNIDLPDEPTRTFTRDDDERDSPVSAPDPEPEAEPEPEVNTSPSEGTYLTE